MNLDKKHCVPCEGGVDPFSPDKIKQYLSYLQNDWEVVDNKMINHEFTFDKYLDGADFAMKVAKLANEEDHHPDIFIGYKKVRIELSTHAINGLSENDFIMAVKIELIFSHKK